METTKQSGRRSDAAIVQPQNGHAHAAAPEGARAPGGKDEASDEVDPADRRKLRVRLVALGVLGLGALGVAAWYALHAGSEDTDDAQVEADVVAVPARTSGVVTRVFISDNQTLKEGDPIAELDSAPQAARLAQAEAELASAEASAQAADAQAAVVATGAKGQRSVAAASLKGSSASAATTADEIAQAQALVAAAIANKHQAQIDLDRTKALFDDNALPKSRLDAAQSAFDGADANLAQAKARLASAQAGTAIAEARVTEAAARLSQSSSVESQIAQAKAQAQVAHARVETAKAARDLARLDLSYTKIVAPHSGVASRRAIVVGQMVAPGMAVVQIVPTDAVWITANFKETQLEKMRVGQHAEIEIDAFPHLTLHGEIESVSGGTGSRFSLLPADNATGNFVKVVQRVPVRVRITDLPPPGSPEVLRPGMSANVTVMVKGK